jgi:ribosomal protein S18 acetylase RimI-like enzyme
MNIRKLEENDALRAQALRLESLQTDPESFGMSYEEESMWPLERTIERLRGASVDDAWFGAFDDDRLIGIASFQRFRPLKANHRSEINAMYVTPDARKKGVGQALLDRLLLHARACDHLEQVRLSVAANNVAAKGLYASRGFIVYGLEPNGLRVDGKSIDLEYRMLRLHR